MNQLEVYHHVNGNHDDNRPENLVLIEGIDHMLLHGLSIKPRRRRRRPFLKPRRKPYEVDKNWKHRHFSRLGLNVGELIPPDCAKAYGKQKGYNF